MPDYGRGGARNRAPLKPIAARLTRSKTAAAQNVVVYNGFSVAENFLPV